MSKPISPEKVEEIISLRKQGLINREISERTSVGLGSVKHYVRKHFGVVKRITRKDLEKVANEMAKDRLTMTLPQVSTKWQRSIRYVSMMTAKHPLNDQFIGRKKQAQRKPKTIKRKIPKSQAKDVIVDGQKYMNKGFVKVLKKEKVFDNRKFDQRNQRAISLGDSKNTVVYVNINDPRSTQEIRQSFINR